MNYFNNINLNQNELQKAVMHPLAQAPATAKAGQMYYNTTDKRLYYYDGAKWVGLNDVDLTNYVTKTELSTDLDKKLDKVTTTTAAPQAYIKAADGTQSMQIITSVVSSGSIAARDSSGRLQVGAGVNDLDAVNLGQMNKAITAGVKVKDVTLDGTSIVNTETGVVALESTPYIELSGTNGSIDAEQYKNLSGDKQSYIILTYTGYPYRLPYVANDVGGLIYSTIIRPRANSKTSLSKLTVYINGSQSTWEASETPVVTSAGGTIDGSVTIGGNLTVQGTTTTVESATLKVKDQLIEVASGNTAALNSPAGLVVPKYDGTNNGALVFDKTGTAYVGDVVLDSDGLIDTTATGTKLVALAGRAKTIARDNLVKWDDTNQIFVDAGIAASNLATIDDIPTNYVTTDTAQTISGIKTFSKEVAFDNHIRANGGVGAAGQVLTSQGAGKSPIWKTISAPSNMVTTDTSQTINAAKIFSKEVAFNDQIRVNGSVGTAGQVLTSQGVGKVPEWTTLTIPQGTVKKFVKDFTGKNTDLEFSYEHELGTDQCTVSLYKLNDSNNYEMVMADIILTTTNVIIKFAQAPTTTDSFRVVVTG